MTWKQFKEVIEQLGMKDDDVIGYTDVYEPMREGDLFVTGKGIVKIVLILNIMGGT
jgi:hypothetical protein